MLIKGGNTMAKTLDDMKMVHEEEMQNYDRIQEAVTRVMHRHGCKIIQTPANTIRIVVCSLS